MRCTACDKEIPDDAAFCVECGAKVATTGRTITLDQPYSETRMPDDIVPAAPPPAAQRQFRPYTRVDGAKTGAIFLIGMAILFFTGTFWPGILALVGITGAINEFSKGRPRNAIQSLVMLVGMAILFATGLFWPGILVLVGIVTLLSRVDM